MEETSDAIHSGVETETGPNASHASDASNVSKRENACTTSIDLALSA